MAFKRRCSLKKYKLALIIVPASKGYLPAYTFVLSCCINLFLSHNERE